MAQCIATSRRSGQRCKRPALVGATVWVVQVVTFAR